MIYGFIDEDLKNMDKDNPLYIQAEYAKEIGKFCLISLECGTMKGDCSGICEEGLLLRTTCENCEAALQLLENLGIGVMETREDIKKIENWFQIGLTRRKIFKIKLDDITDSSDNGWIEKNFADCSYIFMKSLVKGFSCIMCKDKLRNKEEDMVEFLTGQCALWGKELIVSGFTDIKKDSLGTKETRHMIFHGKVLNSSRQMKSLVHNVPKSHIVKAREMVDLLRTVNGFPENYVLDLGEFIDEDGQVYIDIVEINPVSTSMCYLNNSIFEYTGDEGMRDESLSTCNMGPEFYSHYKKNPEMYHMRRTSNGHYSYTSETQFDFR